MPSLPQQAAPPPKGEGGEIVKNPHRIRHKVQKGTLSREALITRATMALRSMDGEFVVWLEEEVSRLAEVIEAAEADRDRGEDDDEKARALSGRIADRAAEIRALDGHGYDLATAIATSLWQFAGRRRRFDRRALAVARLHLDGLRLLLREDRPGKGSAPFHKLVAELKAAAERL